MATSVDLPITLVQQALQNTVKMKQREQTKYTQNPVIHEALQKEIDAYTQAIASIRTIK